MESLHLSIALPSLARKPLPFSPLSFDGYSQPIRFKESNRLESLRGRVVSQKGLVRARQGGGGEEEDGRKKVVFPNVEGKSEQERRRPLWKRGLGFVGSKLGFGEEWEVDPGGERELEELDSFLEGRGAEFRWKDVLEPSVENILALVLTGLFLYAAVLIGWQLLLVAAAITLSALKYAVIAAVLLGVLIFFL
ncbi:hypothetical protein KC19_11G116600 [Ceratodon purpureus]|uniref:Uncharacterized protein n=1 Tax=Ceratodon purpureus TaxID=3225 RepID=A0A8T0GJI4_CERPU|nr:hypothetical protein KC19_11G116600 [Ceratodon purpureus]